MKASSDYRDFPPILNRKIFGQPIGKRSFRLTGIDSGCRFQVPAVKCFVRKGNLRSYGSGSEASKSLPRKDGRTIRTSGFRLAHLGSCGSHFPAGQILEDLLQGGEELGGTFIQLEVRFFEETDGAVMCQAGGILL